MHNTIGIKLKIRLIYNNKTQCIIIYKHSLNGEYHFGKTIKEFQKKKNSY